MRLPARALGLALGLAAATACMPATGAAGTGDGRAALPLQEIARATVGPDQGVFARAADGRVLAAIEADRAVHPASVTKIPTTFALLRRLGPSHRFTTRLVAVGPVREGTLAGDLLVEAERDPFLVTESGLLILTELRRLGVGRVRGRLRVAGPLLFNWQPDPGGARLRRVLAGLDGAEAWPAVRALRPELDGRAPRDLALRFGDRDGKARAPALHHTLVAHRSPPLVTIVKALNGYSNNVFHPLSETIGGPAAVEALARASVPPEVGRSEIVIDNAAGAGETNRLSPRAAAALLDALAAELAAHGLGLPDVMPVAGIDPGTLRERLDDPASRGAVVAKTGTFGSLGACALVGVIRTREYGDVTFAVLNRNLPVPEARRRQDAFVRAVIAAAGSAPFPYRGDGAAPLAEALVERVP